MHDDGTKTTVHLTPDELVERWKGRVAYGTLANWRKNGYGPKFIKLGAKILYPLVEVEAWEARQLREDTIAGR